MDLMKFYDAVNGHNELRGIGVDTTDKHCIYIKHVISDMITGLPLEAVKQASWEDLEPILVCEREPAVLQHMTRVVGYYSRIENFNRSKLGELKDRIKGNYFIEAGSSDSDHVQERTDTVNAIK